jgi:hypothetical protein
LISQQRLYRTRRSPAVRPSLRATHSAAELGGGGGGGGNYSIEQLNASAAGKDQFFSRYRRGSIVRLPIQATSGSGTFTVPSAFWWFSRIAMIARLIATAVPLRVWTNCVPFSPGLR